MASIAMVLLPFFGACWILIVGDLLGIELFERAVFQASLPAHTPGPSYLSEWWLWALLGSCGDEFPDSELVEQGANRHFANEYRPGHGSPRRLCYFAGSGVSGFKLR